MGRRKIENQNVRKLLKKSNGSVTITLPIAFVRELRWRDKQKVEVTKHGSKLVIEDWKK